MHICRYTTTSASLAITSCQVVVVDANGAIDVFFLEVSLRNDSDVDGVASKIGLQLLKGVRLS